MTEATPTPSVQPGALRVPPGAKCATFPERDARFICSRCGSFASDEAIFSGIRGKEACRTCAAGGFEQPLAWERRKAIGLRRAFIETSKAVMFSPTRFFKTPTVERSETSAFAYGVTAYTVGQMLSACVVMLGMLGAAGGAAAFSPNEQIAIALGAYFGVLAVCMLPMTLLQAPVAGMLGIAIGSCMSHGILAMFKSTKHPFAATMRVVSYSNAPYLLYVVPCIGPLVAIFWTAHIEMIGLRELHGTSTDRAVIATYGYRIGLFLLLVAFYAVMVGFFVAMSPAQLQ